MMWFTIVGMACVTYLNRLLFLTPGFNFTPGQKFKRFLSFSSLAVLTAIWAPLVFRLDEAGLATAGNDYLAGTMVAAILSVFRLPSLIVVLTSVAVFFVLRFGI